MFHLLASVALSCVTSVPTTSFLVRPEDSRISVEWVNHNGVEYMPIHEGVVTAYDLPILAERARVLKEVGDSLKFYFPMSGCEIFGDQKVLQCHDYNSEVQQINGHKVQGVSFYSSVLQEASIVGHFSYVTTTLMVIIDGKTYFLPMKYSLDECSTRQGATK